MEKTWNTQWRLCKGISAKTMCLQDSWHNYGLFGSSDVASNEDYL